MTDQRYRFEDTIGEGGLGTVFRAWDQRVGRWVAIKRLKRDSQLEERLTREVGLLASLQHPNIVTILDYWVDEEGANLVMELIGGPTLDEEAEKSPLPLAVFLQFADEICRALAAAHSQGIYHRDLKPGNIMLHDFGDKSFTVKLVDFGMALATGEADQETDEVPVGSPLTVAPEQITGDSVDARTDIYSLGCVFYYVLSSHYPYESSEINVLLDAHLNRRPQSLKKLRPDLPATLCTAIGKMMARLPENRYQSIEEVRAAIRAAVQPRRGASGQVESVAAATARPSPVAGTSLRKDKRPRRAKSADYSSWAAAGVVIVLIFMGLLLLNESVRDRIIPGRQTEPAAAVPTPAAESRQPTPAPPSTPMERASPAEWDQEDEQAERGHRGALGDQLGERVTVRGRVQAVEFGEGDDVYLQVAGAEQVRVIDGAYGGPGGEPLENYIGSRVELTGVVQRDEEGRLELAVDHNDIRELD